MVGTIWIWELRVLLANYYVYYVTYLVSKNVHKRNILSQYNFQKAIALAWINPKTYWKSNSKKHSANELYEPVRVNTRNKKNQKNQSNLHHL